LERVFTESRELGKKRAFIIKALVLIFTKFKCDN
jgi:hypothetical protein